MRTTLTLLVLVLALLSCSKKEERPKDPAATPKADAPTPEKVVRVVTRKWVWDFEYENGFHASELHVPVGVPVALDLTSQDVLHTLEIPELDVKQDAIPRKVTRVVFTAPRVGTFPLVCTAACGMGDTMNVTVHVEDAATYQRWLADSLAAVTAPPPVELGKLVWENKGCNACHTIDGSKKIGVSLKGLWGQTVTLRDGSTAVVDAAFVRNAMLDPNRYGQAGYPPSMPSYQGLLSEPELVGIAAFIESLK